MRAKKPREPRQLGMTFTDEMALAILAGAKTETRRPIFRAPKAEAGDELYARVAFLPVTDGSTQCRFEFRYDLTEEELSAMYRWTPRIYMPKARTPFFLPIVEVVEERLHDITEEGAKAEGAPDMFVVDFATFAGGGQIPKGTHLNGFCSLWDELYGTTVNAWKENPRVRVYRWKEVRRC